MSRPTRFRHRGLQVVYRPQPGRLTAIALTIRAGARFDRRQPGLAHLTEHMLFQGTAALDQVALNRRAAELGGEHNADTGYEDISLTFEVFNEEVDEALALLAEQYYRTHVDDRRLGKERRVVLEEIRGRLDDPAERLHRRAWSRLFDGAIAHSISGTLSSVRAIEARDVKGFLRRHFSHANSVLAIVGGSSLDEVQSSVRRRFTAQEQGRRSPVPPVRFGRGGPVRMRDPDGSQAFLAILTAVSPKPREVLATGVALDIVGADPDSRLFQEVRERLGLSYEVGAHLEWGSDWALAVVSASGARGKADRLVRAVRETCQRAADEGFSADELLRARNKLRYRYAALADTRMDQALALAESILWGFPMPEESERIVESLTPAEIDRAWRRVAGGEGVTAISR